MVETIKQGNFTRTIDTGNENTTLSKGNHSLTSKLGTVTIEAMQSITLKVGQSSIVIDQMGVQIKGMKIGLDAKLQLDAKGLMTNVKGDAMVMIKGGITMIN